MTKRPDHRKPASARIEQAFYEGQREGVGIGLVVGLTVALVAYPAWVEFVDLLRATGIWP